MHTAPLLLLLVHTTAGLDPQLQHHGYNHHGDGHNGHSHDTVNEEFVNTLQATRHTVSMAKHGQNEEYMKHSEHGEHVEHSEHEEHGQHAEHGQHGEHGKHGEHREHGKHEKHGEHGEHGKHLEKREGKVARLLNIGAGVLVVFCQMYLLSWLYILLGWNFF
jgi:hypothetical protein